MKFEVNINLQENPKKNDEILSKFDEFRYKLKSEENLMKLKI